MASEKNTPPPTYSVTTDGRVVWQIGDLLSSPAVQRMARLAEEIVELSKKRGPDD